jgi:hypothetical protein
MNFAHAPANFARNVVCLHLAHSKRTILIFWKNNFWFRDMSFFHETLTSKRHSAPPSRGRFCASSFHAGPKSGVRNLKIEKCETFYAVISCDLVAGKIQTFGTTVFLESPFTEISYHVQGCMAFRSNELCQGPDHRIDC